MQTYSHVIISAFLARRLRARRDANGAYTDSNSAIDPSGRREADVHAAGDAPHRGAFLLGSVAPDMPLILLTIVYLASDLITETAGGSKVEHLFRYQFYHDPWVQTAHNLFHAPLLILLYGAIGYWAWRMGKGWGRFVLWFGAACLIHTLIDIPLHHDDGPLLLFPLDWESRFYSPISYWDPRRFGIPVSIAEHVLVLGLSIFLIRDWRRSRRRGSDVVGSVD